jgi:hypothetical protein
MPRCPTHKVSWVSHWLVNFFFIYVFIISVLSPKLSDLVPPTLARSACRQWNSLHRRAISSAAPTHTWLEVEEGIESRAHEHSTCTSLKTLNVWHPELLFSIAFDWYIYKSTTSLLEVSTPTTMSTRTWLRSALPPNVWLMYATTTSGLLPHLIVQLVQGGDGLLPYLNRSKQELTEMVQTLLQQKTGEGEQQIILHAESTIA